MSWPTPTLSGVDLFGGEGKAWLHAFCQAVNERQAALALTKTAWILADGSEASDPILSDFDGIRVHGTNSPVRLNFQRVQNAIKAMLNGPYHPIPGQGYFTETSGYGDRWTVASIEADMGLGAFESGAFQFHNLNYWEQLKGALDRMIYAVRGVAPVVSGATKASQSSFPPGSYGTPQDAWDGMYGHSETTGSTSLAQVRWQVTSAYSALAERYVTDIAFTNAFSGTLTDIEYAFTKSETYFRSSFDVSLGSAALTLTGTGYPNTSGAYVNVVAPSLDLSLGGTDYLDLEITTTLPTTVPFGVVAGAAFTGSAIVTCNSANLYFDIASILTDQA